MTENPNRPLRRAVTEKGRVSLSFGPKAGAPGGAYLLRGGIAWPRSVPGIGVQGYGVLAGRHEDSGVIFVFEEHPFVTVDWLQIGKAIQEEYEPIAPFFGLCWHYYLANLFYWRELHSSMGEYRREVWKCDSIKPKPMLMAQDWKDNDQAYVRVFVKDKQRQLAFQDEGGVHQGVRQYEADNKLLVPALEALACALVAMSRIERE